MINVTIMDELYKKNLGYYSLPIVPRVGECIKLKVKPESYKSLQGDQGVQYDMTYVIKQVAYVQNTVLNRDEFQTIIFVEPK